MKREVFNFSSIFSLHVSSSVLHVKHQYYYKKVNRWKSQLTNRLNFFFSLNSHCKRNERDRRNGATHWMNGTGENLRRGESHCEWDVNEESACTFVCVDMHSLAYLRALTTQVPRARLVADCAPSGRDTCVIWLVPDIQQTAPCGTPCEIYAPINVPATTFR